MLWAASAASPSRFFSRDSFIPSTSGSRWASGLLVVSLASLIHFNRQALKSRTTAYSVNSVVTVVLVIAIVGVIDFLSSRYPYKIDLTKNKIHTLSEQTMKLVKGLKSPSKRRCSQNRPT